MSAEAAIASEASRRLGVPLFFAVAREPADDASLSVDETAKLATFGTEARRREWRLGRAALKSALRALGEDTDTARVVMPHARVSLTHSGDVALAAASLDDALDGLGVDLEVERAPKPAMARFFLDDVELAWLAAQPDPSRAAHLARLWSIKEAVFKADRANATTTFRDYRLADPSRASGVAHRTNAGATRAFAYAAIPFQGATLAVAVHRRETSS